MPGARPAVNSATLSVGFTTKLVTVRSVSADGKTAVCTDRQNTQVSVPMLVQRSKGLLPAVGETWLVTRDLGQWTFAAFVAQSPGQFQAPSSSSGVYTGATAPSDPSVGELWVNEALDNMLAVWNGTSWTPVQFGAVAIQPSSITPAQLARSVTARALNGITTTIAAEPPASPKAGDLWIDDASGNRLSRYSGAGWVPLTWDADSVLSASTVTSDLLAAGAVVAGKVAAGAIDGMTITGAQVVADGTAGQLLIYAGPPGPGNLIGSWSGTPYVDDYGNSVPAGLSVLQGSISGIGLESPGINAPAVSGGTFTGPAISAPSVVGGSASGTDVEFGSGGGRLLVYSTTTTTVTYNASGTYAWTAPPGVVSAKVECWAAGDGGNGGTTSEGGSSGPGGEYACEPNYPLVAGAAYTVIVGNGGAGQSTGGGNGAGGGDTSFDGTFGVYANGSPGGGAGGTGSTNTVHHNGGNGASASGKAGGSSGASSGAPAAAGVNGNSSSGTTGAPPQAAPSGAGPGGAGGNSGANGSNGSGPGGGGGGAGMGSSTSGTLTRSYSPTWTASYYGPDATGSPNAIHSTTTMYQGGTTASGGSYNGNMRSLFRFNTAQISSDFSGYTITGCTITVTNQHSWYNSGMSVEFDYATSVLGASAPSSYPAGVTKTATGTIAEGTTHTYGLGATVGGYLAHNNTDTLGIGAGVAAAEPYNPSYYGYFGNSVTVTITGTKSVSGTCAAGSGADGQVKITYTSSQQLTGAISPAAGTDGGSNAYGPGYTGRVTAFQPGTTPAVPETWHPVTVLSNGWTVGSGGFFRYRLKSENTVEVDFAGLVPGTTANNTTIWTAPAGYVPSFGGDMSRQITVSYTAPPAYGSTPGVVVRNTGAVSVYNLQGTVASIAGHFDYPLD